MAKSNSEGVGWILNAAGRQTLLTPAEELHLGRLVTAWQQHPDGPGNAPALVQRRGIRARNRMISANLRLLTKLVQKYSVRIKSTSGMSIEDLYQEGVFGITRAAEKFDPERGYKFSTYAYWWIQQSLLRGIEMKSETIRCPASARHLHNRWLHAKRSGVTDHDFAEAEGVSVEQVQWVVRRLDMVRSPKSLDYRLKDDEEKSTLVELISDDTTQDRLDAIDVELHMERFRDQLPEETSLLFEYIVVGKTLQQMVESHEGATLTSMRTSLNRARTKLRVLGNQHGAGGAIAA